MRKPCVPDCHDRPAFRPLSDEHLVYGESLNLRAAAEIEVPRLNTDKREQGPHVRLQRQQAGRRQGLSRWLVKSAFFAN